MILRDGLLARSEGERLRESQSPGALAPGLMTNNDSDQRTGTGSGVVVLPARCMPATVAAGLAPAHPGLRPLELRTFGTTAGTRLAAT